MANICDFSMCVKGAHDDIEKFYNAMSQNGNIYMGRGADAEIRYENENNVAFIDGWCKWSIQSAMIYNAISMRTKPDIWYLGDIDKNSLEFITLIEASERWNLIIEAFSAEPGCEFQEHYIIRNGKVEVNDCVDYYEYYLGDYNSKEEAERELEITITDDEWNYEDYVQRGGFGDWDFEI